MKSFRFKGEVDYIVQNVLTKDWNDTMLMVSTEARPTVGSRFYLLKWKVFECIISEHQHTVPYSSYKLIGYIQKQFTHENTFLVTIIRGIVISGYFQSWFYQNRFKSKVPFKNRPMKAKFLLAATRDVRGRSRPSSPDRPVDVFWTDHLGYNELLTTGFPGRMNWCTWGLGPRMWIFKQVALPCLLVNYYSQVDLGNNALKQPKPISSYLNITWWAV